MGTKPIYFALEADEKTELDASAKRLGIKPSELARRRYRRGLIESGAHGIEKNDLRIVLEYLAKLSSFQYAALERIINQRPENFGPVYDRGADLFKKIYEILRATGSPKEDFQKDLCDFGLLENKDDKKSSLAAEKTGTKADESGA